MRERPTQAARYQPGRDANGLFASGNQIRAGTTNDSAKALATAKRQFSALVNDEQREALWKSLFDLCLNCPVMDVRQKALVYALDRLYGKPTERVEMDVQGDTAPLVNFNLTSEQQAVIAQILTPNNRDDQGNGNRLVIDHERKALGSRDATEQERN